MTVNQLITAHDLGLLLALSKRQIFRLNSSGKLPGWCGSAWLSGIAELFNRSNVFWYKLSDIRSRKSRYDHAKGGSMIQNRGLPGQPTGVSPATAHS